jgi:L-lactate utilization protein LutB
VTTVPRTHIALMGVERIDPTMDDLALMLSLLPRSATGQKLSVYTSVIMSPRRADDPDGPQERHIILVDNGRLKVRGSELREILFCIRCGACLNACPVFREIGGHAYVGRNGTGSTYPGPVGSVISPALFGQDEYGHLARASSLCGACKEACPVDIDLPKLLLMVRAGIGVDRPRNLAKPNSPNMLAMGLGLFTLAATSPSRFAIAQRMAGIFGTISTMLSLPEVDVTSHYNENLLAIFADELQALGGKFRSSSTDQVWKSVLEILQAHDIHEILAWNEDTLPAMLFSKLDEGGIQIIFPTSENIRANSHVRAGLSGAAGAIAETGSILILGGPGRPLTASLLPEIHIAILSEKDIVMNLNQLLKMDEIKRASAAVLISGPSRTADIEMTLTIGVHGPGELDIICLNDT